MFSIIFFKIKNKIKKVRGGGIRALCFGEEGRRNMALWKRFYYFFFFLNQTDSFFFFFSPK